MKTFLSLSILPIILLASCSAPAPAPEESAPAEPAAAAPADPNRGTAEVQLEETLVVIDYGRPRLEGRDMISQLQDGMVWRLGMNEATSIESPADLAFGETVIPAGRHSLWARKVASDDWRLIFNHSGEIWGTERNPEEDFAEVPLEVSELPENVEQFTIEAGTADQETAEILISWGTLRLRGTFSIAGGGM